MEIGMLWFDNTPGRSVEEKVRKAAAYYLAKYGQVPTDCKVAQSTGFREMVDGIRVCESSYILSNHLLIGVTQPLENSPSDTLLTTSEARRM